MELREALDFLKVQAQHYEAVQVLAANAERLALADQVVAERERRRDQLAAECDALLTKIYEDRGDYQQRIATAQEDLQHIAHQRSVILAENQAEQQRHDEQITEKQATLADLELRIERAKAKMAELLRA